VEPDWDLSGTVDDPRLMLELGYAVAQSRESPQWKSASEFKARRDALMNSAHSSLPLPVTLRQVLQKGTTPSRWQWWPPGVGSDANRGSRCADAFLRVSRVRV